MCVAKFYAIYQSVAIFPFTVWVLPCAVSSINALLCDNASQLMELRYITITIIKGSERVISAQGW